MENKKNNKSLIIKITIFLGIVVLLSLAGTLAAWIWRSEITKDVVFNTSKEIQEYIVYDAGDSKFIGDFQPTETFCESQHTTISFYKTEEAANIPLYATINMDINSIGDNISSSTDVYWILTTGNSNITCTDGLKSTEIISYSNFNGISANQTIKLNENIPITTSEQQFTIWIWINPDGTDLSSLTGESLDVNVWTQIDMIPHDGTPNAPVLDDGMIPVTISNNGTVTAVSSTDDNWYDYENKEWANVVLVKNEGTQTRSYYKNNPGETVDQDDILAYYVWIPRYRYKIWDITGESSPQTINIEFESVYTNVTAGTQVDDYMTHPAFIWDGETIAGIWVGKFEASHTTLASSTTENNLGCTDENCTNADGIIIKNDVASLRYNNVSNFFFASRSMTRTENPFGLSLSQTDSHMMKNSEWGAVAYLSHSKYGINEEIRINNNDSYKTGCGASEPSADSTAECQIAYGEASSYPQSTTGNITGIFDMSGGASEYVMGVLADEDGNPRSGSSLDYNSGFNGLLKDDTSYTEGVNFPLAKYYDLYTSEETLIACNGGICYGHALSETEWWYNDYGDFVYPTSPWNARGGVYLDTADAGVFYSFIVVSGSAHDERGFRSVAIVGT